MHAPNRFPTLPLYNLFFSFLFATPSQTAKFVERFYTPLHFLVQIFVLTWSTFHHSSTANCKLVIRGSLLVEPRDGKTRAPLRGEIRSIAPAITTTNCTLFLHLGPTGRFITIPLLTLLMNILLFYDFQHCRRVVITSRPNTEAASRRCV